MSHIRFSKSRRRGAIALMCGIMLVPLLAMMAFAIDTGYMCLTKTELQNAADASALAAANAMQPYFVQYNLPGQAFPLQVIGNAQAAAKTAAKKYASLNTAGNVAIALQDSDITFGFLDTKGAYTTPALAFPNTVAVVARRDTTANGQLQLFFGGLIGTAKINLQAVARATMYTGDVSGVQVTGQLSARMLPIALDINIWQTFYQTGLSPDGQFHAGPNGAWQIQIYPVPKSASGNFSLLAIGPPSNASGVFRQWIDYGMSPSDIQYQVNSSLIPVSPSLPKSWSGGPGMTDTLVSNFADALGKPNLIPLFKPVSTSPYKAASNTGNGATFAIEGFASVIVSQCAGNGSNMILSIQPSALSDGTATSANAQPAGSQNDVFFGTSATTFLAPKLSY